MTTESPCGIIGENGEAAMMQCAVCLSGLEEFPILQVWVCEGCGLVYDEDGVASDDFVGCDIYKANGEEIVEWIADGEVQTFRADGEAQ